MDCFGSCDTWFDNCDEGGEAGWDNDGGREFVCSYVKKLKKKLKEHTHKNKNRLTLTANRHSKCKIKVKHTFFLPRFTKNSFTEEKKPLDFSGFCVSGVVDLASRFDSS